MGNDEYNFVDYSYVRRYIGIPIIRVSKMQKPLAVTALLIFETINGDFDFRNTHEQATLRTYATGSSLLSKQAAHSEGRVRYASLLHTSTGTMVRASLYRYVRAPRLASTERRKKPTTDRACETCKRSPSSTMKVGDDDIVCASKATMP